MACGCPVIASTGGALPEIVGEGGIAIDPLDVAAWAEHMIRMALDLKWREHWRGSGLRRAGDFTWARTAETTIHAYHKALAGQCCLKPGSTAIPAPTGTPW